MVDANVRAKEVFTLCCDKSIESFVELPDYGTLFS